MRRVLVTRPEPGATRTAEQLVSLGYEPIKMPLTQTVGLTPRIACEQFDFVIATSAQAFLWLAKEVAAQLADLPTFVVGSATGAAAREAGFNNVHVGGNGVTQLLPLLRVMLLPQSRVLYLCGKVRRPEMEEYLPALGTKLELAEVYDTKLVSYSTDKLKFLRDTSVDAVLVTSLTTAQELTRLANSHDLAQVSDNATFICQSQRIANGLNLNDRAQIIVCETADTDTMLAQLIVHCPL